MQEIIPLLLNGGDLTPVTTIPNWDRVPWFEETRLAVVLDKLKSPRVMVSHLPYQLMPSSLSRSKAKVNALEVRYVQLYTHTYIIIIIIIIHFI